MSIPLKNYVNNDFLDKIIPVLNLILSDFNEKNLKKNVFVKNWNNLELKERINHIAFVLKKYFDIDYKNATKQIIVISKKLQNLEFKGNEKLGLLFLPTFIEIFGTDDFENSVKAIEQITKLITCEYAVRPFYEKYPYKMMQQTFLWAKNKNFKVRRLASEGCRSKLPWAAKVDFLTNNPNEVLKILEILIFDDSAWVRKSVANNLNDISKNYPEKVLNFASKYIGKNNRTNKMLKHSLRYLLKISDKRALKLFGYIFSDKLKLLNFKIKCKKIKINDNLIFTFSLNNKSDEIRKLRLEYVVYYQKLSKKLSPKVYQIGDKIINPYEKLDLTVKRSFKKLSTQKFYAGKHKLSLIVNGKNLISEEFWLIV